MAKGAIIPPVIDPPGYRRRVLCIPDSAEWESLVMGAIKFLTFRYYWQGDEEAIDEVTAVARKMYIEYQNQNGECVLDCEDIINCLDNDADTQEAVNRLIQNYTQFPQQFPPGQNLPDSETGRNAAEGTNPTCDLDILCGQCYAVIDTTYNAIIDVLEKVEASTNVVEFGQAAIGTIPLVAGAEKAAGIDGALSMINYYQEAFNEGFVAQYTTTPGGTRDQLMCALFCECRDDCVISIDRIVAVLQDRLSVYTAPPSLEGLVDFVETLSGINQDTTFVVDLAFFATWGSVKVGNYFFGGMFNSILDIVLKLAVDTPSNDWLVLCDCPDTWCIKFAASSGLDTVFVPVNETIGNQAQWSGTGWERVEGTARARITILGDLGGTFAVTTIRVVNTLPVTDGDTNTKAIYNMPGYALIESKPAAADVTFTVNQSINDFVIDVVSDAVTSPTASPVPGEIIEIYVSGTGTPPPLGENCE